MASTCSALWNSQMERKIEQELCDYFASARVFRPNVLNPNEFHTSQAKTPFLILAIVQSDSTEHESKLNVYV
jgi:hypothetical protein